VPRAFMDLADGPPVAALTTLMPDGCPHTTVVWCDLDGAYLRVNTMRGFRKEKNMRQRPQVTLLCFDPREPLRFLEVRGTVVEMTDTGALEHLDSLSRRYTGLAPYFGACVPAALADIEEPILCRIEPTHIVTLDCRTPGLPPHRPHEAVPPPPDAATASSALQVPASHLDLLLGPVHAVLTTLMPDGQPQSSLVWCDYDGECARVNTTLERRKGRNLGADPRASLLVVDPDNTARFLAIRGDVQLVPDPSAEHLDALTRQYTDHPRYYGCVFPADQQQRETRVVCRLHARKMTMDAIHS